MSRIDGDGIRRFFEIGELAGQELFRGVVSFARMQSLEKKIVRSFQIGQLHAGINLQALAVDLFKRGARQHDAAALRVPLFHGLTNGIQPGDAVVVVERYAVRHFLDVGRRMKVVAVGKFPSKLRSQQLADGGLSGSGGTHQEDDHGSIFSNYTCPRNSPSSMWK